MDWIKNIEILVLGPRCYIWNSYFAEIDSSMCVRLSMLIRNHATRRSYVPKIMKIYINLELGSELKSIVFGDI